MSFDPMAAAIDWLDAYRASDLETMLEMFADNAVIECGCCAMTTFTGKAAARAYWEQRFQDCAPSELADIQPYHDWTEISYLTREGVVAAALSFNADGKITSLKMGSPKETLASEFERQKLAS